MAYKPRKLHLRPDMYRHISHFFLFHQINGVPQFTVVQLVIWSGKSLSCRTRQPGKTWKSRTKWSHESETERSLFFFFPHSSASSSHAHFVLRHVGSIHERAAGQKEEKKPLDLQPPIRVRPQKPKREFNSCWS